MTAAAVQLLPTLLPFVLIGWVLWKLFDRRSGKQEKADSEPKAKCSI
jgi:hypothetical protein